MKPYNIKKAHYELRNFMGRIDGVMQERKGGDVCVNLIHTGQKTIAVESCARHLTNYGRGTQTLADKKYLMAALYYLFGNDAPTDVVAVKLKEGVEP